MSEKNATITSPQKALTSAERSPASVQFETCGKDRFSRVGLAAPLLGDVKVIGIPESREPSVETQSERIREYGFAQEAPSIQEQAQDSDRTMPFRHLSRDRQHYSLMQEKDGIAQMYDFLGTFIEQTEGRPNGAGHFKSADIQVLHEQAKAIMENLTFVGAPEYAEATRGLGDMWKDYLRENKNAQLCVISGVSELARYNKRPEGGRTRKSDDWLREDILLTFSDEELEEFGPRIVTTPEHLTADPENARIALLDDWSISGTQLRNVYSELLQSDVDPAYIEQGCVEVNLLVASPARIESGLTVESGDLEKTAVPVKGYFRSRFSEHAPEENQGHVTGLHSSVNYGFRDEMLKMSKAYDMIMKNGKNKTDIALLRVDPWYKDVSIPPVFSFSENGIVKVSKEKT